MCSFEGRALKMRVFERCALKIRLQEVSALKVRVFERCALKIRLQEVSALKLRVFEPRALKLRVVERRALKLCLVEMRTLKVRPVEHRALKHRLVEIRVLQVRVLQIGLAQVRATEKCAFEMLSFPGDRCTRLFQIVDLRGFYPRKQERVLLPEPFGDGIWRNPLPIADP